MAIIIKNGNVVLPFETKKMDIRIENEKIVALGEHIETNQDVDEVIDARGRYILAGGIDAHTHFDLDTGVTKTADDFYSGSRAAIAGGTTTILDFATQNKGESLSFAMKEWHGKAKNKTYCDYGFHMAITDWNETTKHEMKEMVANGITSFKMYMAYPALMVSDGSIYEALKESAKIGGIVGFHCENGSLIQTLVKEALDKGHTSPYYHMATKPNEIEAEAICRLLYIAKLAGATPWVVHLSTAEGLKVVKEARHKGMNVVLETCPQYLLLDKSVYGKPDDTSFEAAKYVISPPIRSFQDNEALWKGVEEKAIDFISTDHCSFNFSGQKELGRDNFSKIPNGGPGVEHRLLLMYEKGVCSGKMTINGMSRLLSLNPAKTFGLTEKGSLEVGKDADLVIFNPQGKTVISAATQIQNVDYTPYEGIKISGKIEQVLLRGQHVYKDDEIVVGYAVGKYQHRGSAEV